MQEKKRRAKARQSGNEGEKKKTSKAEKQKEILWISQCQIGSKVTADSSSLSENPSHL
jgi:hypothetical protein